jgi:hypothetical protein
MVRRLLIVSLAVGAGALPGSSAWGWSPVEPLDPTFPPRNVTALDAGISDDARGRFVWADDDGPSVRHRRLDADVRLREITTLPGPGVTPDVDVNPFNTTAITWIAPGAPDVVKLALVNASSFLTTDPQTISALAVQAGDPRVAIDRFGNAFVIWRQVEAGFSTVFLRRRAGFGGTLGPIQRLSLDGRPDVEPRIVVDPRGGVIVSWETEAHQRIEYARVTAAGAIGPTRANLTAGRLGDQHDIAVADDGDAVAVWRSGRQIRMRTIAADDTLGPIVDLTSADTNARPRIAVDQDGTAAVVWLREAAGSRSVPLRLVDASGVPGQPLDLSGGGVLAVPPAVVKDAGRTTIAWERQTSSGPVLALRTRFADGSFGVRALDVAADGTTPPALDQNRNGGALAGWRAPSGVMHSTTGAPRLDHVGAPFSYTPGSTVAIAPGLVVTDHDDQTLARAQVKITSGCNTSEDRLDFTPQNGITGGSLGVCTLELTGTATVAQYQSALRSVTYHNVSATPSGASRRIGFTASDRVMPSRVVTRQIDVP